MTFIEWEAKYRKDDNNPLSADYTGDDMRAAWDAGYLEGAKAVALATFRDAK